MRRQIRSGKSNSLMPQASDQTGSLSTVLVELKRMIEAVGGVALCYLFFKATASRLGWYLAVSDQRAC